MCSMKTPSFILYGPKSLIYGFSTDKNNVQISYQPANMTEQTVDILPKELLMATTFLVCCAFFFLKFKNPECLTFAMKKPFS